MRNLKKFLALVLALMMAMSLMVTANASVTANVEYKDDGYQINDNFQEAVTVLSGMGVIKGYDDGASFGPQRKITRAEAAALIYRLATGDVTDASANLYAVYGNFPDVKQGSWYAGYVGYCANYGIIKGRPDGTFDPTADVTGYEILAMILRVVGYDKNGEFSGGNWAYNVATLSTSLGVKRQVNAANYGEATFYQAATREVVASLLFETIAYVPKVIYVGSTYANTGMTGGLLSSATNPTVGYEIFGLRNNHGIVVGNEETGEKASTTKIGFDLIGSASSTNYCDFDNIDDTLTFSRGNSTLRTAYLYESGWNNNNGNVTLAFKWDSGLDYFGHKVNVWYSDKSREVENVLTPGGVIVGQFPTNLDTYAVFDETLAENIKVVSTADGANSTANNTAGVLDLASTADKDDLVNLANFDKANGVYWNYSFGPTKDYDYQVKPEDSYSWQANEFESPILKYNSNTVYPLYLTISNHPDGKVDMVIALELTITQIAQVNNYYSGAVSGKVPTIGVFNNNDASDITNTTGGWTRANNYDYFDTYDNYPAASGGVSTVYTQIAQANLTEKSTKTLNDKVVAIAITGTNGSNNGSNETGTTVAAADPQPALNAAKDRGNASAKLNSSYYYKVSKLTNVVPATVYTVDTSDGTVTLSDGSKMKVSKYANVVDAGFATAAGVKVPGMNPAERWPQVNASYNFTLDREGNYIYWEPITSNTDFVYATYLDYGTPLSSSTYTYQITYVDGQGEGGLTADVTKYNRYYLTPTPGWETIEFSLYSSVDQASGYSVNRLVKRDSKTLAGAIEPGRYIGYIKSGSTLTEVTPNGSTSGFYQGSTANFSDPTGNATTTISSSDALAGAKQVSGSDLFLTENTVFHIVSGAGTDTQKVTTYNGLSKLLEGNRSVIINGGAVSGKYFNDAPGFYADPLTDTARGLTFADMIYFNTEPFTYAQNYGFTYGSAQAAKVVYIPADAVTFNKANSSSLYFVGDSSSSIINAYGENAVQFDMFKDGKSVKVWVQGNLGDDALESVAGTPMSNLAVADVGGGRARSSAGTILHGGDNVFYDLEDTGKKTNFNEPIYKIVPVADSRDDASDIIIGRYYGYNATSTDLDIWNTDNIDVATPPTVLATPTHATTEEARYVPTTNALQAAFIDVNAAATALGSGTGTLYNVANALVDSANDEFDVSSVKELSEAGSLYDNWGVRVSCVLSADSTRIVNYIYVNK